MPDFTMINEAVLTLAGFDPISLLIYAAIAVGSYAWANYESQRARSRARRNFEEQAGVDIRITPSAEPIPLLYGYTAARGILAYAQTSNELGDGATQTPRGFGDLELQTHVQTGVLVPRESKFNEFLLTQNVISVAGIEALRDIHLDDKPWASDGIREIVAHGFAQNSSANPFATSFTDERDDNSAFAGLGYITGVYRYDIDDPVFFAPPRLLAFVDGQKIPAITSSNQVSAGKTFSTNAVRVLLDYLISEQYGPGLSPSEDLDLASFRQAQVVADRVVQGSGSSLWNQRYPAYLNTLNNTNHATWEAYFRANGYDGEADSGLDSWHGGGVPVIRRYECNGNLPTTRDFPTAIEQILETMPGVRFWRSLEGKYKIKLPDTTRNEAVQSVMEIGVDQLYEPATVVQPSSETKLNQRVVKYANARLDLANDTLTWPAQGTAPYSRMRAEDGDITLKSENTLELTNNPYHAASIAANETLISRRPQYRLVMRGIGLLLEPGDVVHVVDPRSNVDDWILIDSVEASTALRINVTGIQFRPGDYEWITEQKTEVPDRAIPALTVPAVSSVQAVLTNPMEAVRFLDITWALPTIQTQAGIERYVVELATFDAAPTDQTHPTPVSYTHLTLPTTPYV